MQHIDIDDKLRAMMTAITALGDGWHTRKEIAEKLGRRLLTPADITMLEVLVRDGELEIDQRPRPRNLTEWIYKIKGDKKTSKK